MIWDSLKCDSVNHSVANCWYPVCRAFITLLSSCFYRRQRTEIYLLFIKSLPIHIWKIIRTQNTKVSFSEVSSVVRSVTNPFTACHSRRSLRSELHVYFWSILWRCNDNDQLKLLATKFWWYFKHASFLFLQIRHITCPPPCHFD